jgi:hypothetical protein
MSTTTTTQVDIIPVVDPVPSAVPVPVIVAVPVVKPTASVIVSSSGSYTFLYGLQGMNTQDVTSIVYTTCTVDNIATIPGGDENRSGIFQCDPVFGYYKEVYIIDSSGTQNSYGIGENIFVNFSTNTITTTPFQG